MPQDRESGERGRRHGYSRADMIAELIGAVRLSTKSNEFEWKGSHIAIKTGSSPVVTRNMLGRADAIVYGHEHRGGWVVYSISPEIFERLSVQSRSSQHNENYRQVRGGLIREHGTRIHPLSP
jgi:hypothetical protein